MTTPVPSILQPPWFFALFALWWLFVTGVLAYLSGWATLAGRYRADVPGIPGDGARFRFSSGSLGRKWFPVNYGNCLFVTVTNRGLRLSIFLPFRFLCPPLFIPWEGFTSVSRRRVLFIESVTFTLRGSWALLSLRGRAGEAAEQAFMASQPSRI